MFHYASIFLSFGNFNFGNSFFTPGSIFLSFGRFSNYGKRSTISAPGVNIFSCKPGGQFVSMDGTSMSSPIISGVIGLMKSIQPELSNKEIIEILQKSGKNIDTDIGPLVQVDKVLSLCINEQFISEKKLNTDSIKNEIKELQIRIQELKELL